MPSEPTRRHFLKAASLAPLAATAAALADEPTEAAEQLRKLDLRLARTAAKAGELAQMLSRDVYARRDAANRRESEEWSRVKTRADWERYRDTRLKALRDSLGGLPVPPRDLKLRVTGVLDGDGYRVENVVFESRPGLLVTANLYRSAKPRPAMPGIQICHSHHNPKTQGELQDMGMTWARLGCLVLVMDQLGHGERRQHPFVSAKDYAGAFRVGRQDYYFRYNLGVQLHLAGDSLIGWMVYDLMRGVDLLLAQPGIDKERIILLGAVAGGGDPAAVAAALDRRITAAAPFNFGGPQPETTYPLPAGAEASFNYAGGGSWESTRNLRLSARDGFLPWVIVGAVAPRRLIYGHEFAWDRERDPVWKRLETIYGFYGATDRLAFTAGRGSVSGQPPESTHCNNIGPEQRKGVYAAFKKWFDLPVPEKEHQQRHKAAELLCLTPDLLKEVKPDSPHEREAPAWALRSLRAATDDSSEGPGEGRKRLRSHLAQLLGDVEAKAAPRELAREAQRLDGVSAERALLEVEPNVVVPLVLLLPRARGGARGRVVVGVSQQGKQALLKARADLVAGLLGAGVAVCLPDVRGTGETRPGDGRGRGSAATAISSTELMLGQTLVGSRLRDLRSVLKYLRTRKEVAAGRIGLWGDSLAPANPDGRDLKVPLDAEKPPDLAEPLGGLLALLGALFEDDVTAVYVRGGLSTFRSALRSPFVYLPHDAVVPGVLAAGDLPAVAGSLAPRPVRLEALVDGLNRRVKPETLAGNYASAEDVYRRARAGGKLVVKAEPSAAADAAAWLRENIGG
jgi:dienelactone hydrolase